MPTTARLRVLNLNFKAGPGKAREIVLGRRGTVVCGPIGVGKTRVPQGLMWLVSELVYDSGRKNPSKASAEVDIRRPAGDSELYVEAVYDEVDEHDLVVGEGYVRRALGLNPETKRPRQSSVLTANPPITLTEYSLPVALVIDWLSTSPENAWAKFLPHIAYGVRGEAVVQALGAAALEEVQRVTSTPLKPPTSLDALASLRAKAHTEATSAAAQIKTSTTERDGAQALLSGVVATTNEIEERTAKLKLMDEAIAKADANSNLLAAEAVVAELTQRVALGRERIAKEWPHPGDPPAPPVMARAVDLIERGNLLRAEALALKLPFCPASGVAWAGADLPRLDAALTKAKEATTTHAAAMVEYNKKLDLNKRATDKLGDIEQDLAIRTAGLAALRAQGGAPTPPEKLAAWKTARAAASEALGAMKQNRGYYEKIQQQDIQIARLGEHVRVWGLLETACANAVEKLMKDNLARFIALVQEAVPPRWQVRIDTDMEGSAVFRPWLFDTLEPSGPDASGGQRGMMLLGLARAVVKTLRNPPPLCVFALPEERSFDGAALGDLCRALAKLDGPQWILTNIEPPAGRMPDGVVVHNFGPAPKRRGKEQPVTEAPPAPPAATPPAQAPVAQAPTPAPAPATAAPAPAPSPESSLDELFGTAAPAAAPAAEPEVFADESDDIGAPMFDLSIGDKDDDLGGEEDSGFEDSGSQPLATVPDDDPFGDEPPAAQDFSQMNILKQNKLQAEAQRAAEEAQAPAPPAPAAPATPAATLGSTIVNPDMQAVVAHELPTPPNLDDPFGDGSLTPPAAEPEEDAGDIEPREARESRLFAALDKLFED